MCAVELSCLREVCVMTKWEGESNERRGMGSCANGVKCDVVK